jgi:CpcD/allophycocyanin linker domain
MAGMLTGDRMVRLEVAGMCQQQISRTSNYAVTVPYSSMSQAMQNIQRRGGKVIGVHVSDVIAAVGTPIAAATKVSAIASDPAKDKTKGKKKK